MGPKKRGRGGRNKSYNERESLTKEAQTILRFGYSRGVQYLGVDNIEEKPVEEKSWANVRVVEPPRKPKENTKKNSVINSSVKAIPPVRKRFVDVTSQSSYNSSCLQKLTLHKFVMNLVSMPNIASYFSITPDFVCYEMEFEKFLDFVYNFEEPGKSELARAIFPLFVLFYINILQSSISDAETFYDLFVYIFDSAEGYEAILKELYEIKEMTHITEHPYFSKFREMKYILRISAAVLQELNTFLIDIESKALWKAFSFCFYYEDPDVELYRKTLKTSTKPLEKPVRRPAKTTSGINYDHYYSFASKRRGLENTKPPLPVTVSKNVRALKVCIESEGIGYLANLRNFEKKLINEPPIIETFIECTSDISALDLNQNETEFTVAFGTPFIFISPMRKYFPLSYEETVTKDDDHENHECEDERAPTKVPLSAPVYVIKYFPNQPHSLLAASGTTIVKVNTDTETVTSIGIEHTREIRDIDINSTGSLFCSAGRDEICHLWSVNDSSLLRTYVGHENDVNTIKFHKNGTYLMSGSKDHTVRLWNIENAVCLRSLIGHKSPVMLLTCSPDRKTVVSADSDGIVKLWDINEALENMRICDIQCYKDNKPDGSMVTSLSFGNNNFLAMCNNKGVMRIWDIRKPQVIYNSIPDVTNGIQDEIIPVFVKSGYLKTWNIFFQQNLDSKERMEVD